MKYFFNKHWFLLSLVLLCLTSLSFHFSSLLTQLENDGRFQVSDPDSVLFLRYYEQSLLRGETLVNDEYGTFPNSRPLDYPPVHLQLYIGFTHLVFYFLPDLKIEPEYLIGWMPPFFGWLVGLILIAFAWQKTRNKALTLLIAFSCTPGVISSMNSLFMRVDYHFLNCFFIWSWLYCAWAFVEKGKNFWGFAGALIATIFILTWSGTPLFFALMITYIVVLWLCDSPLAFRLQNFAFLSMASSAALVMIYLWKKNIWITAIGSFGWFQPAAILTGGLFLKGLILITRKFQPKPLTRLLAVVLFAVAGMTLLYFSFPEQMVGSFTFLLKGDPLMQSVAELQPGLRLSGMLQDVSWFRFALSYLGIFFFLFPVTLTTNPGKIFSGPGRILRDAALIFVGLGLHSIRFYRWLGMGIGFLSGLSIYAVFCGAKEKIAGTKHSLWKFALLLMPFLLLNFLLNFPHFFGGFRIAEEQVEAYEWIRKETPVTSGYFDQGHPEYGIYCFWGEGNRINYYAQRPTLVNNAMWGYLKMAAILTSASENEAYSLCEKYRVRYFYISSKAIPDPMIRYLKAYKDRPGMPEDNYVFFPDYQEEKIELHNENCSDDCQQNHKSIHEEFEKTFHFWLSDNCAIKPVAQFLQPASRLRIVYSAKQFNRMIAPEILLYEMVAGAKIFGQADAGSIVRLSLECNFDKTRQLYAREVKADEQGNFEIIVPYSTGYDKGRISTEQIYKLSWEKNGELVKGFCSVAEQDLWQSARIAVKVLAE